MLTPSDYFDLTDPLVSELCARVDYVWELVVNLPEIVNELIGNRRTIEGNVSPQAVLGEGPLVVCPGATIEPGAYIMTPAYIGAGATVRHGAYVRPFSVIMERAILGHASEIKSSLMLPHSQAPHFAYVGDSVLGRHVNLGAGTKLSNVPITAGHVRGVKEKKTVHVKFDNNEYDTAARKFGAILGDEVQIGCNAVLNPGTFVGPRTMVYPNAVLNKGFYQADSIVKLRQQLETVERHS